jgi:hypothetical protein
MVWYGMVWYALVMVNYRYRVGVVEVRTARVLGEWRRDLAVVVIVKSVGIGYWLSDAIWEVMWKCYYLKWGIFE